MSQTAATPTDVKAAIGDFCGYLTPDIRERFFLTDLYRIKPVNGELPHWPRNYSDVLRDPRGEPLVIGAGVYLHFDADDRLLYVGKAVSLGSRLGAYFRYTADKQGCEIIDAALNDSCGVRLIPCEEEISFLAPALEWFLIGRLKPRVNLQGKGGLPG